MNIKLLVIFGGVVSIGFGLWHLFVPKLWEWYSYYLSARYNEPYAKIWNVSCIYSGVSVLLYITLYDSE